MKFGYVADTNTCITRIGEVCSSKDNILSI